MMNENDVEELRRAAMNAGQCRQDLLDAARGAIDICDDSGAREEIMRAAELYVQASRAFYELRAVLTQAADRVELMAQGASE
jgi:hypothetical protein